jgi:hypothetical protein
VITSFNPETLVTSVHIDHTGRTGNNHCSIILITETVELLEHSVGLHKSVYIIGRVSSVFSVTAVVQASLLSPEI